MSSLEVELRIWGDRDEIQVLHSLPVGATWRRGDPVLGSSLMKQKQGGWSLASGVSPKGSLEEHVQAIQALIGPHAQTVANAAHAGEVELSIALYMTDPPPLVALSSATIVWLASLGSALDIDAYGWEPAT